MSENVRCDVAIIGSGFAGSILGQILVTRGLKVIIIDPATHPRFAIGESSTPIADAMLRSIGKTYGLNPLVDISAWGSWQRNFPDLAAGKKRGFSYFFHESDTKFRESHLGEKSLLIAASADDESSDTHWYRADVDQWLFQEFCALGGQGWSGYRVTECSVSRSGNRVSNQLTCQPNDQSAAARHITADWVVDASGGASVLAKLLGGEDFTPRMRTKTRASFAHFDNLGSWSAGHADRLNPFDADDAAQHHLIGGDGWMWMLRFDHGRTSVGWVQPLNRPTIEWPASPSIAKLFESATMVPVPGMIHGGRLQRWSPAVLGSRRLALPTAAATIDPLHSTGIAHALAGVRRVAKMVLQDGATTTDCVEHYGQLVDAEVQWLDRLVSLAYDTIGDFERFSLATLTFILAAIRCEERLAAGAGEADLEEGLYGLHDVELVRAIEAASDELRRPGRDNELVADAVAATLAPWNHYGLFDRGANGRYAYTATKKVTPSPVASDKR
jgi:tetracycline 7-halogenase / FADH2 O2-dependent halogenase